MSILPMNLRSSMARNMPQQKVRPKPSPAMPAGMYLENNSPKR